jgi:hypothetical protein
MTTLAFICTNQILLQSETIPYKGTLTGGKVCGHLGEASLYNEKRRKNSYNDCQMPIKGYTEVSAVICPCFSKGKCVLNALMVDMTDV